MSSSFLSLLRVLLVSLLVSSVVAVGNTSCKNPKVRREWRKFTTDERTEWIRAVNCLSTRPHNPNLTPSVPVNLSLIQPINPNTSYYDDLVYMHMDLNPVIHFTGQFLPWHRYYVQFFEDQLIKQCDYKGVTPYWDWTIDAHDVYNSAFFDNSSSGVGGWGDANNDNQISTGGFKDVIRAYPNPHHIRRKFSLYPGADPTFVSPFAADPTAPRLPPTFAVNTTMTQANVDLLVDGYAGDFIGFHSYLDSTNGIHPNVHIILGGDMAGWCPNGAGPPECYQGPKWTSNDPLFFMHHATVDKVWYDWQQKSLKNQYAYGGGSIASLTNFTQYLEFPTGLPPYLNFSSQLPGDGMWSNVTIWDVMDTTGDTLCYVYDS